MSIRTDKALQIFEQAKFQAKQYSKDPSTQVSANLVDPLSLAKLARGYNGMPRGCHDTNPVRLARPEKYNWFEHAERNGVYNAVRPYLKGSIALLTEAPNMDCARGLASVGVVSVIAQAYHPDEAMMTRVRELFAELHIEFVIVEHGETTQLAKPHKIAAYLEETLFNARLFHKPGMPKSAAMLIDAQDYTVLSEGYSGMPRLVEELLPERLAPAEAEYWVEYAARNAIYNAARRFLQGSTAVVTMFPCAACARALVQVGVKEVIAPRQNPSGAIWDKHFDVSRQMFAETGVSVRYIEDMQTEQAEHALA